MKAGCINLVSYQMDFAYNSIITERQDYVFFNA